MNIMIILIIVIVISNFPFRETGSKNDTLFNP